MIPTDHAFRPEETTPWTDPLAQPVSIFAGAKATDVLETVALGVVLTRIQDGTYREIVTHARQQQAISKAAYRRAKEQLPAFTPCCALHSRDKATPMVDKLRSATGIVHFDFDDVPDPAALKQRLAQHPSTVFAFRSPGSGVKVGIAATGITDAASYRHPWSYVLGRLKTAFPDLRISEDPHVKFLHALCFVSDDPDLSMSTTAVPLQVPTHGADDEAPPLEMPEQGRADFNAAWITGALTALPSEGYDDWIAVGQALHSTGHPLAKGLWDWWSERSPKYNQAVQDAKWKGFTQDGGRDLGEIYTRAHQQGWRPNGWLHEDEGLSSHSRATKVPFSDPPEIRANGLSSLNSLSSQVRHTHEWPVLQKEALYGLAGDFVRAIEPQTEADPVALLAQFLAEFGVVGGRHAYTTVGATRHYGNLFLGVVGKTSRSRKGTSYGYIEGPMHSADPTWGRTQHIKGAGSGEGLIYAVRDQRTKISPAVSANLLHGFDQFNLQKGVRKGFPLTCQ